MLKHFAKKRSHNKFPSPLYSAVFNAIPWNKLISEDELPLLIQRSIDAEYSNLRQNEVMNLVHDLAKLGFIGEFPGVKLERLLDLPA